jgi:N-acetylglucosaminyldiphosphoundecaprenol N-acetyl-beta-D-mannosaminyltransferase
MLIGSKESTNIKATNNLREKYPNIVVLDGLTGGMFTENDQISTVEIINRVKPNIIMIGVSSPKKEAFAYKWKDKLDVNIIVPFGGMIDGLAGEVKLVPPLFKKMGLGAWYRALQEPKRMLWNRLYMTWEFLFRVYPVTFFQLKINKNKNFFIPSLYGIRKK